MARKIHKYTCKKGYADQYKGREITWEVFTTPEEAISAGHYPDMETVMQYANAQLNIRRGHAVQKATVEVDKDKKLVRPSMTTAEMETVARSANAEKITRQPGGKKAENEKKAQRFETIAQKSAQVLATATPEKLALMLELGNITQEQHDARLAELQSATPAARGKK